MMTSDLLVTSLRCGGQVESIMFIIILLFALRAYSQRCEFKPLLIPPGSIRKPADTVEEEAPLGVEYYPNSKLGSDSCECCESKCEIGAG